MNDIKPSPLHICLSILIALVGLKLLIAQMKGSQFNQPALTDDNPATIVISPLTWMFTLMSIFQSILIGLLLYFIRSILLKLSSMDAMFFSCLETLGHNQTVFLQELEMSNDTLFDFLTRSLLSDSVVENEPIGTVLTRIRSRMDTLNTSIHRMDQSMSKSLRDINHWITTSLTPLALPPLLIPPPTVLTSHQPAASQNQQQLNTPSHQFQFSAVDTEVIPLNAAEKRSQTIPDKIPDGVKGRDYILKTELGVFNLGTKQGRDEWQELVKGRKTVSEGPEAVKNCEKSSGQSTVGNFKFGSNNVYGQGLKMSNLVIARSPSGSTETSAPSCSDKENGTCSNNLDDSTTAATAYTEEAVPCSGEYGLTLAELTSRLEEGERKQYRRIFLPGRGWAPIKRLQQEMESLKQKQQELIAN